VALKVGCYEGTVEIRDDDINDACISARLMADGVWLRVMHGLDSLWVLCIRSS